MLMLSVFLHPFTAIAFGSNEFSDTDVQRESQDPDE